MAEKNYKQIDRRRQAIFLRTIRKSRGYSRQDLADKAGYDTPAIITAIENASKDPEYEKIKDLANALDVSIDQLMGFGKISSSEKGYAKLSEAERIALFLFGPIIKKLNDEEIRYLTDTALLLCKAKGAAPDWKTYSVKSEEVAPGEAVERLHNPKREMIKEIINNERFRSLYAEYMYREIGINDFAKELKVSREDLEEILKEFTATK